MTIRIKNVIRTDQLIVFIFVWKLRAEIREKIHVFEHSRFITREIVFRKNLKVSKLYIIFGGILRL